jgi:2'-5' RNA ligase
MRKVGRVQKPETTVHRRLRKHYDQLWSIALGRIRAGRTELDPILQTGAIDRRRGLTVVARPSQPVQHSVALFVRELRRLEPDQYYYHPSEFHLTVLSLFTATVNCEPYFALQDKYVAAVDSALKDIHPIHISFEGITASPSTIMIQGFFETHELNDLRNTFRRRLRIRGLGKGLDDRYRLQTAHMTVVRFRAPLRHPERFANVLEQARQRPFGTTAFRSFLLVENDWYMSRHTAVSLERYS